jgi:hypothetical protein
VVSGDQKVNYFFEDRSLGVYEQVLNAALCLSYADNRDTVYAGLSPFFDNSGPQKASESF